MEKHKIAVIAGDGIGPEVIREAMKVLAGTGVSFKSTTFDISGERYLRDGCLLDQATLGELRDFDAILLVRSAIQEFSQVFWNVGSFCGYVLN